MSRVDEIRKRSEAYQSLSVRWDELPRNFAVVAEEFRAAAPEDISYLLARVEKLKGLLTGLAGTNVLLRDSTLADLAKKFIFEARTLLADESKENEHGSK